MATLTILKAIKTQLKDVMAVEWEENEGAPSEVWYDLSNAVLYVDAAIHRIQMQTPI
jgi:hypothetical protein